MRVEFEKELNGYESMKEFIEGQIERPRYPDKDEKNSVFLENQQNFNKLMKHECSDIERVLKTKGYQTVLSADNALWISQPYRASINLSCKDLLEYYTERKFYELIDTQINGPQEGWKGFLFGTKTYILRKIPSVKISGVAKFQDIKADPKELIETLTSLNYQGYAIPTRKEIQEAYMKGRRDQANATPIREKVVYVDDDDDGIGLSHVIAFGLGTQFGK